MVAMKFHSVTICPVWCQTKLQESENILFIFFFQYFFYIIKENSMDAVSKLSTTSLKEKKKERQT